MSKLFSVGIFCFLISIWGTLQLFVMALCYYFEAVTLIEDVEEEDYEDYDDFIKKTSNNYASVSRNCCIAGIVYFVLIFVCYGCIVKAKSDMRKSELMLKDDDYFCTPKKPPPLNLKKIT